MAITSKALSSLRNALEPSPAPVQQSSLRTLALQLQELTHKGPVNPVGIRNIKEQMWIVNKNKNKRCSKFLGKHVLAHAPGMPCTSLIWTALDGVTSIILSIIAHFHFLLSEEI